jgi:hypothetical protein
LEKSKEQYNIINKEYEIYVNATNRITHRVLGKLVYFEKLKSPISLQSWISILDFI